MTAYEKITYNQACEILGISIGTLKQAVFRNMFTRLPRQGLLAHLIKEQVVLFKGKDISFSSLTDEEIATWEKYDELVKGKTQLQLAQEVTISEESIKKLAKMLRDEIIGSEEPSRTVLPFRSS